MTPNITNTGICLGVILFYLRKKKEKNQINNLVY